MNKNIKFGIYGIGVLLILSVAGYYVYPHAVEFGLAKPALILKVSTNISEQGQPMINNATFEQSSVPFFYKRADTIPDFPEIQVSARLNEIAAAPVSYWASAHYEGEGNYSLKLMFRDKKEPKKGDILIMPIRIIGQNGAITYKTTAFYLWE